MSLTGEAVLTIAQRSNEWRFGGRQAVVVGDVDPVRRGRPARDTGHLRGIGRRADADREQGDAGGACSSGGGQGGRRVDRRTIRYDDSNPIDPVTTSWRQFVMDRRHSRRRVRQTPSVPISSSSSSSSSS